MPEAWTWPAYAGVLLGSLLFIALFAPILVWQSRRFGRLSLTRTVASGLVAVYAMALIAYTLLPLPAGDWCAENIAPAVQWRPFHSLDDIAEATQGLTPAATATSFAVLQVVLNVVLFVPWGAFVRRLFGRSVLFAGLSGVAMSLFIEITQGTGVWGLYGCAYRVADVDDVLTNSLGAFAGALLAPLLLWWLPETAPDEKRRADPRPVTRFRRLAGMIVDAALFFAVWFTLTLTYRVVALYGLDREVPDSSDWFDQAVPGVVALMVVVVLPALSGSGASPGQRAIWLAPTFTSPLGRLRRVAVGFGGYAALSVAETAPVVVDTWAADLLGTVTWFWAVVAIAWVVFDRSARGLSYRVGRAKIGDARER